MQNKVSVIIITGNEENNISACLESVSWADEIVVVDSESTDNTVGIAKEFTDKIFIKKWEGYSKQKAYALSLVKNDWILSIDADERVSNEFASEIKNLGLNGAHGFRVKRANYFLGKLMKGCGWGNDWQLRLVNKNFAKLSERQVHEKFIVEGEIKKLESPINHYSYSSITDALNKINNYSTLEATEKLSWKRVNLFTLLLSPPFYFLHNFILRKGFLDGYRGLIISYLHMMTKLQVQLKILELKKAKDKG